MSQYRMRVRVEGLLVIEADSPDAAVAELLSLEPTIALANKPHKVFDKQVDAECEGERENHHLEVDNAKHVLNLNMRGGKIDGKLETDAS